MKIIKDCKVMDHDKIMKKISKKCSEIFELGQEYERNRIFEYLARCAEEIDFDNDTPNNVINELIEIMKEKNI